MAIAPDRSGGNSSMETFFVRKQLVIGALLLAGLQISFVVIRMLAR
jgi:hypothetical protein